MRCRSSQSCAPAAAARFSLRRTIVDAPARRSLTRRSMTKTEFPGSALWHAGEIRLGMQLHVAGNPPPRAGIVAPPSSSTGSGSDHAAPETVVIVVMSTVSAQLRSTNGMISTLPAFEIRARLGAGPESASAAQNSQACEGTRLSPATASHRARSASGMMTMSPAIIALRVSPAGECTWHTVRRRSTSRAPTSTTTWSAIARLTSRSTPSLVGAAQTSVVDLACGTGLITAAMAIAARTKSPLAAHRVCGIDGSARMLARARMLDPTIAWITPISGMSRPWNRSTSPSAASIACKPSIARA